ncbi:MAG: HTH domain-containing protein [Ferroplasma sp.]|uniref:helix-turn-helix transcriptional regulator n=1 Tax=Ferroplasma sp. TaxID=2591003 RepID=UPI00281601DF|nr:winged helix-turn-helix transcriptional regulator [Ferroplasma sp.]WMT51895.1 MAG: HTH domain-containing protein [Ferroplasma sp.]
MEEYPTPVRIILLLKKNNYMSLEEMASSLGITKMAVLNHITVLEQNGSIGRKTVKKNVGRPSYVFYATENADRNLGSISETMLDDFMNYMKMTGREKIIEEFLKDRYSKVRSEYAADLAGKDFDAKVRKLALLREGSGYYPELKKSQENYEMVEYNCPILAISKHFGIACSMETGMFENVLDSEVKSTHRQVNGYGACRFIISRREENHH